MRYVLLLFAAVLFHGLTAQQVSWLQHAGATLNDIGSAVDIAPNGDVVVVGHYSGTTPADFDAGPGVYNYGDGGLFVARYAPTGEVLHVQECLSSLDHGFYTYPPNKEITMRCAPVSGNIYIAGDRDVGTGDLRVIKADPQGNLIWMRDYEYGFGSNTRWTAMDVDSLDNVYLAGDLSGTMDFDPSNVTFNLSATGTDFFITKLDSAGNFDWAVKHDWAFSNDHAASICVRDDSTLFLLSTEFDEDIVGVYEYGTDGTMHVRVPISSNGGVRAFAIDLDEDRNIYIQVSCITEMDMDPFTGVHYFYGYADAIAKYDPTMHYRWHKIIRHTEGAPYVRGFDVHGEHLDLGGSVNGDLIFGFPSDDTLHVVGALNAFIARYDTAGTYLGSTGLRTRASCEDVVGDGLGNVYACGEFFDSLRVEPDNGIGLVPAMDFGHPDYWLGQFTPIDITTGTTAAFATEDVGIFPNPSTGTFTLRVSRTEPIVWTVFDALGRSVAQGRSEQCSAGCTIDIGKRTAGVYTLAMDAATERRCLRIVVR